MKNLKCVKAITFTRKTCWSICYSLFALSLNQSFHSKELLGHLPRVIKHTCCLAHHPIHQAFEVQICTHEVYSIFTHPLAASWQNVIVSQNHQKKFYGRENAGEESCCRENDLAPFQLHSDDFRCASVSFDTVNRHLGSAQNRFKLGKICAFLCRKKWTTTAKRADLISFEWSHNAYLRSHSSPSVETFL